MPDYSMSELENTLAYVLKKHPEIEPLVEMVYARPWTQLAGVWRKKTIDGSMVLSVNVEARSATIRFLSSDNVD